VATGGVAEGLALRLAPPDDHDAPRDGLQRHGHGAQDEDGGEVGRPPPLLDAEDGHALEYVDDAEHDDGVPHRVVVRVPVQPVPVPLVGPDEQREDLDRGEGEGRGADAPVKGVGDSPTRCRG
jgi:hypothetical protein